MVRIDNTQTDVYFIARSNDFDIVHHGFLEVGSSMISGQDVLETFETDELLQIRLTEINGL